MLSRTRLFSTATRQFAAVGAAFGLLFPIGATGMILALNHLPLSLAGVLEAQRTQPLLWVIDSAPLFLGIFAALVGRRQDALHKANDNLQELSRGLESIQADQQREIAKRTAQLAVSAEVGQAITSILDPDDLIRQVVQLITVRFDFYYTAVFVVDDEGTYAVLRDAAGPREPVKLLKDSGHRLRLSSTSMVSAAVTGKAAKVANRVKDDPSWFANPVLPETRSEVALPLSVGGRVFGALDVQSQHVDRFDESSVAMLQSLADQIAIALNNASQFRVAQNEARQATALFEASRLAGLIDEDLTTAANHLLSTVAEQAGFDNWLAVTYDQDAESYTILAGYDTATQSPSPVVGQILPFQQVAHMPFAQAVRSRQSIVIDDAATDSRLANMPDSLRASLFNMVSTPVILGERVLGAISLGRLQTKSAIVARDVQLAEAIANQLAVTIQNRRLFEQAQATTAELNRLMQRYMHENWTKAELAGPIRHEYRRPGVPELDPLVLPQVDQAARADQPVPVFFDGQSVIGIPIELRGEVIGTLGVQDERDRTWSEDELVTLKAVANQVAQSVEVARLLDETESSLQETTKLYQVSRAVAASTTSAEVMHVVVNGIRERLGADQVRLSLFDEELGYGFVAAEAMPTPGADQMRIPMAGNTVYETLAETRRSLVIYDVEQDPKLGEDMIDMIRQAGCRAMLFLPLLVGTRLIGWLGAGMNRPYQFSDREIVFCETLNRQVAAAIENRQLFESTQQRAEIEMALNQISQTIKASLDPQAVLDLETTIAEMGHVMRSSRSFYLANEDDLRFVRAYEWCGPGIHSFKGYGAAWSDVPHMYQAFKAGRAVVSGSVERDDLPEFQMVMRTYGTRAHIHVPVLSGNRLIGILGFDQVDHERRWAPEEVSMTQRIADQLAAALENARLYQNVRARVNELTALTRIGRRLAATLELDEVLNTIVEEAVNVTPAGRGSIALYNTDQDALEVHVLIGYPEDSLRFMRDRSYNWLRRGDGLHGRLMLTGQAVLSNDVKSDPAYLALDDETRSELIVPIKRGDSLLGALNLESARIHAFSESDQRLIEALADQAAVAIINARAYQSERAALERMREVDRLKTQFLANMSHELRTPLNSIIGFSRVILRGIDGPLTELQQADLTAIHSSGQHLLGLINDVLDLSKIEAGKMELSIEDVDLADIVKGVMSTAIALVKDRPVELRQEVPASMPPLQADSRRIRQVILNLVSNAAKFTDKGHILTRVTVHPREIQVSVSDTGMGIPHDKLDHIFEEFTQVDASTTRKAGGTGLGLAITRHFVEMHRGRIWVESQLGAGSTFSFTLPLELPQEERFEDPSDETPVSDNGKKLILSIDDDAGVITLYNRYLEKKGYQVIGLSDASRAVEEAKRLKPFAITLDVLMPNRDGWSVLAELKSTPEVNRIPIIVCSIIEDESKGFSLGATDYLVKPITETELLRALERVDRRTAMQTVLVVDDEPDAVRLVRRVLESRTGYRVTEATGGAQAISAVQAARPDVVLLDLMMPDIDGFGVLDTIRNDSHTYDIPVIVITAKELTDDDRARLEGRVTAWFSKGGLNAERLLSEIATALGKLSAERASAGIAEPAEQPAPAVGK